MVEHKEYFKAYYVKTGWDDYDLVKSENLYTTTISELVISSGLINNSFSFYATGYDAISDHEKTKIIYAFWKQLNTWIREPFCSRAFKVAILHQNRKAGDTKTYGYQLLGVYDFCNKIGNDMENKPEVDYNSLKDLLLV